MLPGILLIGMGLRMASMPQRIKKNPELESQLKNESQIHLAAVIYLALELIASLLIVSTGRYNLVLLLTYVSLSIVGLLTLIKRNESIGYYTLIVIFLIKAFISIMVVLSSQITVTPNELFSIVFTLAVARCVYWEQKFRFKD